MYTIVWENFTVGYFRAKIVRSKIFSSLGVPDKNFLQRSILQSNFCFIAHELDAKLYITVHSINVHLAQAQTHHKNCSSLI